MRRKKMFFSICLGMIVMILTGCVSEEERAQAEAWRKRAEENAVTYIQEKYGFEATVVDSKSQRGEDLFTPRYLSKTLVTMEYNGKQFKVLSYGEDDHMDAATDNYQKDAIVAAYKEEVTALFGVEPDGLAFCAGDNQGAVGINGEEFCDMFFREYYDGTNLEEVMTEYPIDSVAEYVGDLDLETLYEQNKTPLFDNGKNELAFITYDSRENMESADILPNDAYRNVVYENAMYVKSALVCLEDEVIPVHMTIKECDGFYYMNPNEDLYPCSIAEGAEICDVSDFKGHGFLNPVFATDSAYFATGEGKVKLYLYIPEDRYAKIPTGSNDENVVVASKCYSGDDAEESYRIWHRENIPGYVVFYYFNADARDVSFRFMYDAEESE